MKNTEALTILNALKKLDTYTNEEGHETPYHFGAEAAFAIGKNIRKLTTLQEDLDKARVRLIKAVLKEGEKEIPAGDERLVPLSEEVSNLYEADSDFTPHKFNKAALKAEINPLRPSILAIIDPLLLDEAPAPAAPAAK